MLPILFQSNSFILYSYPLLMGLAWGIGYQVFFHQIEDAQRFRAQIFFWGLFLSAWIGAKVLFIITSAGDISNDFLSSTNFWLGGGFVFYGGLIGGAAFVALYHFIFKLNAVWIKWAMVSLALGHGIGRIGCFLAGCCYGEVTDMWWAIHLHGFDRHPTQLIEAIGLITLAYCLKEMNNNWKILGTYCLFYGSLRFVLEILRDDQMRGLWVLDLTPSQWISIFLVITGAYLYVHYRRQISK